MTVIAALAACASNSSRRAPVADRSLGGQHDAPGTHTVIAGDTLYSIAWEAGEDYKEVARWNGISPPYLLKPGQKLILKAPVIKAPVTSAKKDVAPKVERAKPTLPPVAHRAHEPVNIGRDKRQASNNFGPWAWPVRGKILNYYAANGPNKGIDIGGERGQSIHAAASGKAVYIGSGLRGYGQLIILKHSDDFLSAYAHNEKIYVKEGDVIQRGQAIAAMGSSGADRVKLHFEIRHRGVPVDPLQYLPTK